MIVQKEFLTKLREFGLNSYESKLWTALLSRGSSTAGELSDIAGVPRSRSYDVLESLEKKGFIITKPGKPIQYVAVPPESVIDRIKKKIEEDTKKHMELITGLKTAKILDDLNGLYSQGIDLVQPTDLTGSIKGRDNIYNHLETMIKKARKSVLLATTEKGLIRKSSALKEALATAKQNGAKIKIIAPLTKDAKETVKSIKHIADIKQSDVKMRCCVIDGKEILFILSDEEKVHPGYEVGVWVNTERFGSVLEKVLN